MALTPSSGRGGVGALAAAEDVQAVPLLAQLVAHAGLGGGPVAIGAGGVGGQAGHQALGLRREHVDAEAAAELGHPGVAVSAGQDLVNTGL